MSELENRIRDKSLLSKITTPEKLIPLFEEIKSSKSCDVSHISFNGFSNTLPADSGKYVPLFEETEKRILNVGFSGFTPVGYPKVMPLVIADYVYALARHPPHTFKYLQTPHLPS